MTGRAQELLREASVSAADDRADVEAAWASVIEKRARRAIAGESTGEAWDEARTRVVQRLAAQ